MTTVGQNCVYIYTIYDRIFGDFPAKNTIYTPYVYGLANPAYDLSLQVDHYAEAEEGHAIQPEAVRVPRENGAIQKALCRTLHPGKSHVTSRQATRYIQASHTSHPGMSELTAARCFETALRRTLRPDSQSSRSQS